MSRIGKKPISVPDKVKVRSEKGIVYVEGPKGKLEQNILQYIDIKTEDSSVLVQRPNDSIACKVNQGTMRSLIFNMVHGVSEGFSKTLIIDGVGFKAAMKGKSITLNLGFSHPIDLTIPEDLAVKCSSPTEVEISGIDKQRVGYFAAKIRALYEPEPYKGKGIRYSDEVIRRKAGKSVAK